LIAAASLLRSASSIFSRQTLAACRRIAIAEAGLRLAIAAFLHCIASFLSLRHDFEPRQPPMLSSHFHYATPADTPALSEAFIAAADSLRH